ncbi:MAG: nitroreductase family protein [Desulfarculus sp.]|nr:nitroreductase family protein [Pseudomonadota bacterium]MBV1718365.1 nitroreductase family protein [Desulfarculus sp.]MBU4574527.1 nitroreductase family protein [Pseudomonadota bacterium]MBU4599727.1 nitroreductase family protein [Pseudomonadota bacterium]MBV1737012.1 nitroreductase family protein [Desulfarculus sp.]
MGIVVDREKCNKDKLCALDCPIGIITMDGPDGFPAPAEGFDQLCINCGHCVAVCPHEALSQGGITPRQCLPLEAPGLGPEQLAQLLKGRRSIRRYKEQPLEQSTIARLLDMARYAPSGHNVQPVKWLVISGRDKLMHLAGIVADWMRQVIKEDPELAESMHLDHAVAIWESGEDRILRGAPHVVLAYAEAEDLRAVAPCILALGYIELAAYNLGLGACWAGYLNRAANNFPPMIKALGLPEGMASYGALMLGVPKYKFQRIPPRKPLEVTWR